MMRQCQFDVINYINDILGIDLPSKIDASFVALQRLLHVLGFEISEKKLEKPFTQLNCLGIIVNTKEFTVSIPKPKIQEIMNTCNGWRHKTHCTKHQLQSLLGSLLYISKCVKMSRFFLNRLLDVLRSREDNSKVPLTLEAKRDINWFIQFLPKFNGVISFDHRPINAAIELDASLQGLGTRWGTKYTPLPSPWVT